MGGRATLYKGLFLRFKFFAMNILLLGSGGREHALAWKMAQSPKLNKLFVAPGNAGTSQVAQNVDLAVNDFEAIATFCLDKEVNMLVVGPEDPLVNGIKDFFTKQPDLQHIGVIGPDAESAQLEGSKEYCKQFMEKHGVPTAAYQSFTAESLAEGQAFLETLAAPYVLKADGLAGGKGVLIIDNLEEAKTELASMLSGKFGTASQKVVIEEFLDGIEFSVFALTDGKDYVLLPVAKDYKRIGDGDTGLNTGGMGAVSPVSFVDDVLMRKVEEQIVKPTIDGFAKDNMDYTGFVFFGLIKVGDEPKVIEYNVRLGDPETEVVLPRLKSDLVTLFEKTLNGELSSTTVEHNTDAACTVMVVSEGYPGAYPKGKTISGLENVSESLVFHAGTKNDQGKLQTSGGRVMAFTSYGNTQAEALKKSYQSINKVCFEGITFRKDIGFDL